jgi:hypothetical protein
MYFVVVEVDVVVVVGSPEDAVAAAPVCVSTAPI